MDFERCWKRVDTAPVGVALPPRGPYASAGAKGMALHRRLQHIRGLAEMIIERMAGDICSAARLNLSYCRPECAGALLFPSHSSWNQLREAMAWAVLGKQNNQLVSADSRPRQNRANKKAHAGGMPAFEPTADQRECLQVLGLWLAANGYLSPRKR